MNPHLLTRLVPAMIGLAAASHAAIVPVPNGDFEAAGTDWDFVQANGHTIAYPATGGNPGGHAVINGLAASETWFAVLVANNNSNINLATLGLEAGNTYNFLMDMKLLGGANIGGLKIEWPGGETGDMYKPLIGDGSTWETYSFEVTLPAGIPSIKVVPLWGPNSQVAYDNVGVDNTPITLPPPPPPTADIPNGDFNTAGGASWEIETVGPAVTFPATGGNPAGHALIDATNPGFAAIYAFNGAEQTFASLGLLPGETYVFQVDMKLISGTNLGGLRIAGPEGYVFESRPAVIGDGSQWATYSIDFTVPFAPAQAKFGLIWGIDSIVAFDNARIGEAPPPMPFAASIDTGIVISWDISDPDFNYQPQKRNDENDPWENVGGQIPGTMPPFAFDKNAAAFYQVIESEPDLIDNIIPNPGFEGTFFNPDLADNWNLLVAINGGTATIEQSYPGGYLPYEGSNMLVMESVTPAEGPVNAPDVLIRGSNFFADPQTTYTVSFQAAHVIKTGGANPQMSLFFSDDEGNFISNQFVSFAEIGDQWTRFEHTFTTPPGTGVMNVGWIHALGAGNGWQWVTLIDDVELIAPLLSGYAEEIDATTEPGVEVRWPTTQGMQYQVRSSGDLSSWSDYGTPVTGTGAEFSIADPFDPEGRMFYQVIESEAP